MAIRVKVCGLTRPEDVRRCVAAGVDALGLNFWPGSKRRVSLDAAQELVRSMPPHVLRVGVFVRASAAEVRAAVARLGLGAVQLHGDEDPSEYAGLGAPLWQVIRVHGPGALSALPSPAAAAVLLDAHAETPGGTGRQLDWALVPLARRWGLPLWLAGGLTPENVAEAIRRAAPDGVDVASGVESAPGIKDTARVESFVAEVRASETRR